MSGATGSFSQESADYQGSTREAVGAFSQIHHVFRVPLDLEHPVSECSSSVITNFELFPDTPLNTPPTEGTVPTS